MSIRAPTIISMVKNGGDIHAMNSSDLRLLVVGTVNISLSFLLAYMMKKGFYEQALRVKICLPR